MRFGPPAIRGTRLIPALAVADCRRARAADAPPERIRGVVREVFERDEFNTKPQRGIFDYVLDILRDIFEWLGNLYALSPLLYWTVLLGCIALLVALLAHIAWTLRSVFSHRDAALPSEAEQERIRLSRKFAADADILAEGGDFTGAIRSLFLSLVYRFDESGRIGLRKGYTNREYLPLFEKEPGMRDDLEFFVVTLDDYWYGQRPADRGQYDRCRRLFDKWN